MECGGEPRGRARGFLKNSPFYGRLNLFNGKIKNHTMKIKKKRLVWGGIFPLCLFLLATVGSVMSQVNEPKFNIIRSDGAIQVRDYPPLVVAEVHVEGQRNQAISKGFRFLFDYIFGDNIPHEKITMTAPVTQQDGQKIPMSTPVTQQSSNHGGQWIVRFIMPTDRTEKTLPEPQNKDVNILSIPAKRYVVVKFSGFSSDRNLENHLEILKEYVKTHNIKTTGHPIFAFYDSPWTVPFLKRNEIMMEIEEETSSGSKNFLDRN